MSVPRSSIKFSEIVAGIAIFAVIFVVSTLIVVLFSMQPPVKLDVHHNIILKDGETLPSRSFDATGDGWCYHFTRFNSYRAPDWQPKPK